MAVNFRELKEKLRQQELQCANVNVATESNIITDNLALHIANDEISASDKNRLIELILKDSAVNINTAIVADNLTSVDILKVLIDYGTVVIRLELPYSKIYAYQLLTNSPSPQENKWYACIDDKSNLYKLQRGMKIRIVFELTV